MRRHDTHIRSLNAGRGRLASALFGVALFGAVGVAARVGTSAGIARAQEKVEPGAAVAPAAPAVAPAPGVPAGAPGAATKPAASRPATAPAAGGAGATTAPAAAPALPPRAVALAFAAHLEKGDAAAARALAVPDKDVRALVEATAWLAGSLKKLDGAAVGKFGEPGRAVSRGELHMGDSIKALEQAAETVQGEEALVGPPSAPVLRLRRVEGQWRVVLRVPAQGIERTLALYRLLGQAADQTAAEIAAGQHATAAAAGAAFARRVFEARVGA